MTGAKFDIEKFDGTGDFGLWRIKMRALLIQHGCEAALEVLPADMEAEAKAELNKKAHSAVILCLALDFGGVMATLNSKEFKERSRRVGDDGEGLYGEEELIDRICISQWESQDQSLEVEDSRCSYHMTPRLDIFFDFLECDGGSVLLGDNKECKIRGLGKVRVQLRDGSSFVLNNVRYIPELKRNLISLGTLEKEGFTVKMQSGKVKVINGSRVVLSGTRRDNCVYSLDGHAMAGELNASVVEKDSLAQVWHKRLGHISEAGLQVLEKQGLFGKKSLGKLDFCENCVLGKSHRVRFGVGRHTTQGVVDYIHSDLWGPSQVESLGGKRYFLSIIDDYSRRVWVYILRFKHEAFGKFKEWKQLVENQTGRTVKKLRTDNGLEFCNREFEQLCIESGIARHLTVAGTPQQNGVASTVWDRTLMDKVTILRHLWRLWSGHVQSDYGMFLRILLRRYPPDKNEVTSRTWSSMNVYVKDTLKIRCQCMGSDEELQAWRWNCRVNQLTRDREPRTRTKPLRFQDESNMAAYAFAAAEEEDTHEPLTYQEAVACEDSSKWKAAMKEEMDSLRKNKTWELVDPPAGQKLVSSKWLYKIKEGIEGVQKPRYKARLVARGFTQRAGIDYNEVFSPVVRHTSIRVILALTACKDYELEQLDVKTAFLHGNLEEVIYMRQPPGYEQGNKVCLLKKSLYGLKQSPRQWYRRFDEYMLSNGFKRSRYDSCVYYKSYAPGEYIYLLLYVDDMLIACKSKAEIGSAKSLLKKEFDMKELGEAKKILGMEIVRDRSRKILRVSQSGIVRVRDCDVERMSKVPYANAVGSLMYLMVCTRPDIAYAVSVVSRYLANPGKNHWEAVKWILKYLRGTANVSLLYGTDRGNHVDVTGFVDSDYAKDPDKGRSITGYAFLVQRCVVSWKAMLQQVVALSTTEAEYMALTEAVKEAIWLRGLLEELGVELNTVAVNCDNQGAIHLSRNHVFHERTKHINVRYHFIREVLEAKTVEVLKVGTEHNAADALTKVVPGHKLQHCLELLSVGIG
ncbi:retrotransposon protein, putative, ty1-copia subclass [Tanacetum coccineum]